MIVFDKTRQHIFYKGLLQYLDELKVLGFEMNPYGHKQFLPFGFGRKFLSWRGGIIGELRDYYGGAYAKILDHDVTETFSDYARLYQIAGKAAPEESQEERLDRFGRALLDFDFCCAAPPELLWEEIQKGTVHREGQPWTFRELIALMGAAEEHPERVLALGTDILSNPADQSVKILYFRFLIWMLKAENPENFYQSLFQAAFLSAEKETEMKFTLKEPLPGVSWQLLFLLRELVSQYADRIRNSEELDFYIMKKFIDLQM